MNTLISFFAPILRAMRRLKRKINLTKRQEFVFVTALATVLLLLSQLVSVEFRYPMVIGISIIIYFLSALVLRDDLKGIEWFTLLALPTLFTAGVLLFYFLLPTRWLTRVPVVLFYSIGFYALLLTENIYNVASVRTIALLRAAHTVGFLLTLVSFFLLLQSILAFRLPMAFHILAVGMLTYGLSYQALWSVELTNDVSRRVGVLSFILSLLLMQLSWVFMIWPVSTTLVALFLTTYMYSAVGMAQQFLIDKLYKKTILEFTIVLTIVFFIFLFGTHWRGLR